MPEPARPTDDAASNESPTDAARPEPGQDSRVEDWMGQSVERDRKLAEELTSELGEDEAERRFNEEATGRAEQDARHGPTIDPDQGQSAYQESD